MKQQREKAAGGLNGLHKTLIAVTGTVIFGLALCVGGFVAYVEKTPIPLSKLATAPNPTVVYDRNGKVYMKIGTSTPDLAYNQIPKDLQDALVATEDHNFWTGSSIDVKSILRSAYRDLLNGNRSQGGSTIEEQLAKIVYLNDNKSLSYKFKEIAMGVQLNRYFTKQQILTMYFNKVFLGENAVGVKQAALRYFGVDLAKHPNQLTLDEAALLAGLPQAPSAYDPLLHPQAALTRRNQVLQNMVQYGYITQEQASAAEQKPLRVRFHTSPSWNTHPLFTNILFDDAKRLGITSQQIMQGGLKIYTTIDPAVQNAVHQVFWEKKYDGDFPGQVEGAAVFVDPKSGGVLGAAGSRRVGFAPFGTDRIYSDSSPGSSIKPIMEYAPAIESGKWGPNSILSNKPQNFGGGYTPQNWEGVHGPTKVTLKYALQWSQNIASVWLLQQIGIHTGTSFATKDGIQLTTEDKQHLGVAIGGMQYGVNPMEMAQAYEAFDNSGVQAKAHLITSVTNQNGQKLYRFQPISKRIMSSQTANVMTNLLETVVNSGTGTAARVSGWGVAGKTGTVQYGAGLKSAEPNWIRDAWFDGYTANLVGSVHIGYDVSSPAHHMTMSPLDPSANAAKVFADIVRLAEHGKTPQQFRHISVGRTSGTAATATPDSKAGTKSQTAASNTANSTSKNTTGTSATVGNTTNTSGTAAGNTTSGNGTSENATSGTGTGSSGAASASTANGSGGGSASSTGEGSGSGTDSSTGGGTSSTSSNTTSSTGSSGNTGSGNETGSASNNTAGSTANRKTANSGSHAENTTSA